jgi:hypothetical protein
LLLCRVAKNSPGPGAAPSHPVEERAATSAGLVQTWDPTAQRSATLHPVPDGFELELPDTRPHTGASVKSTPGSDQPPEQPAMPGYVATSTKPSRVPSLHAAQPLGGQGLPLDELLDAAAPPPPPLPSGGTDRELLAPQAARSPAHRSVAPIHRELFAGATVSQATTNATG